MPGVRTNAKTAAVRLPLALLLLLRGLLLRRSLLLRLTLLPHPLPPMGSPLVLGPQPSQGKNRLPSTTSTGPEYRGAFVHESIDDRCFGKIFLKAHAVVVREIDAQNDVLGCGLGF